MYILIKSEWRYLCISEEDVSLLLSCGSTYEGVERVSLLPRWISDSQGYTLLFMLFCYFLMICLIRLSIAMEKLKLEHVTLFTMWKRLCQRSGRLCHDKLSPSTRCHSLNWEVLALRSSGFTLFRYLSCLLLNFVNRHMCGKAKFGSSQVPTFWSKQVNMKCLPRSANGIKLKLGNLE